MCSQAVSFHHFLDALSLFNLNLSGLLCLAETGAADGGDGTALGLRLLRERLQHRHRQPHAGRHLSGLIFSVWRFASGHLRFAYTD